MRDSFRFDTDLVEKIIPNFDGTYTVHLKDGNTITDTCERGKFDVFEEKIKNHQKYKDIKTSKGK